jgi:hypothetical protein
MQIFIVLSQKNMQKKYFLFDLLSPVSCIFVDALTWTSHSLRTNRPYLLELEICDLDAQFSHVQRIAFIRPLPIGKRQKWDFIINI